MLVIDACLPGPQTEEAFGFSRNYGYVAAGAEPGANHDRAALACEGHRGTCDH